MSRNRNTLSPKERRAKRRAVKLYLKGITRWERWVAKQDASHLVVK